MGDGSGRTRNGRPSGGPSIRASKVSSSPWATHVWTVPRGDPGSAGGFGDGEALVQEIADDFEVFSRAWSCPPDYQTLRSIREPQCTPVLTLAPVPQNEVIDHSPSNSLRDDGIIFNLLEEAVTRRFGGGARGPRCWAQVDVGGYLPFDRYPDDELFRLLGALPRVEEEMSAEDRLRWF